MQAGKPTWEPMANCFSLQAPPEYTELLFGICQILFHSRQYSPYHQGSVITFVPIDVPRKLIAQALTLDFSPETIYQRMKALQELEVHEQMLRFQLQQIPEYRTAIVHKVFAELHGKKHELSVNQP